MQIRKFIHKKQGCFLILKLITMNLYICGVLFYLFFSLEVIPSDVQGLFFCSMRMSHLLCCLGHYMWMLRIQTDSAHTWQVLCQISLQLTVSMNLGKNCHALLISWWLYFSLKFWPVSLNSSWVYIYICA